MTMMSNVRLNVGDYGERELIKRFISPNITASSAYYKLDDCAIVEKDSSNLFLISTDQGPSNPFMFRIGGTYKDYGDFVVTMNVSDIAAMGGTPIGMVMALSMRKDFHIKYFKDLISGIMCASRKYRVPLLGGDTKESDKLTLSITIFGTVDKKSILTRTGCGVGDIVAVSGKIGRVIKSYIKSFKTAKRSNTKTRLLRPKARLDAGNILAHSHLCTSCIDMSDGLIGSALQLGEINNVTLQLDTSKIPIVKYINSNSKTVWMNHALNVGGDYELLFTLKDVPASRILMSKMRAYEIGVVKLTHPNKQHVSIVGKESSSIQINPWEHFKTVTTQSNAFEALIS